MRWLEPFAKTWAANDPEAALAWAQNIDDYGPRADALALVYQGMFPDDREALTEVYKALPMGLAREKLTPVLAKQWLVEGSETALQWAHSLSRDVDRRQAYKTIWIESVRKNPDKGFAFIAAHQDEAKEFDHEARTALKQLAQTAAPNDPLKQLTWLVRANVTIDGTSQIDDMLLQTPHEDVAFKIESLAKGDVQRRILGTFIERWAIRDRETTQTYIENLPHQEDRRAAAKALVEQTIQDAPKEVVAWMNTLPEASEIGLGSLLRDQPELAYTLLDKIANESIRTNTIEQLIWHWDDAATTVTLLDQLPSDRQAKHYSTIAFKYTRQDPEAASAWLASLPDGGAKDRGIKQMLRILTQTRPGKPDRRDLPTAFQWAQVIQDEGLMKKQMATWMRRHRNPDEARTAVENANIPLALKDELLARFPK